MHCFYQFLLMSSIFTRILSLAHLFYAYFTHGPNKSASTQYDNTRGAWLTQEGCTLMERKEGRKEDWSLGFISELILGPTVEACMLRALPDSKCAILLPPSHKSKKMLPRKRDTSHSHTKGPFSGPALTIMSFNVEGLSAAKEQLIADLRHRLPCAVVCIHETNRGPDAIRPSIPGMDLVIERPHSQYGSAIFVTSGTIVNTTSLTDINNIEILRVYLNGISVTSIYKPPGERFSFHQPLPAVGDQQQVIIGHFNSHSSTLGYATTNTDGELVED